jgi:hypothetical protein
VLFPHEHGNGNRGYHQDEPGDHESDMVKEGLHPYLFSA